MKNSLYILIASLALSCAQPAPEVEMQETASDAPIDSVHVVAPISEGLIAYGSLQMLPNSNVLIHAFFEGRIKEVNVLEGQSVQAGDVLATLDSPELVEQQVRYYTAGSNRVQAKQDLERNLALHAIGSLSDKVLAESRATFNTSDIAWKAAAAQLQMAGVRISEEIPQHLQSELVLRSPTAGQITAIQVNRGDRVTREDEVMRVANNLGLRAEVLLRSDRAGEVALGDSCQLTRLGDNETHLAVVEALVPLADATNNMVKVRCRAVSDANRWIEGERVMVHFAQ